MKRKFILSDSKGFALAKKSREFELLEFNDKFETMDCTYVLRPYVTNDLNKVRVFKHRLTALLYLCYFVPLGLFKRLKVVEYKADEECDDKLIKAMRGSIENNE